MKTPDKSFFYKLQSRIEDILDDEQLSIGKVGHPYTVPTGYFNQLKTDILSSIKVETQSKGKVITFPKFKVWYGAAAAILVFTIIGSLFYNANQKATLLQDLSQDDILAYLETEPMSYSELSNAVEFNSEDITALTEINIPLIDEYEYILDSPDLLIQEIEQIHEK